MENEMMMNDVDLKNLHPLEILKLVCDHDPEMEFKGTSEGYSIRYLHLEYAKTGIDLTVQVYHTIVADAETVRKAWEECGYETEFFLGTLHDVKCGK